MQVCEAEECRLACDVGAVLLEGARVYPCPHAHSRTAFCKLLCHAAVYQFSIRLSLFAAAVSVEWLRQQSSSVKF